MIMTVGAAGALCGIPISGAINKATGGFEVVGYYAGSFNPPSFPSSLLFLLSVVLTEDHFSILGSITVVSVIFMLITRHLVLGRLWGKF